MSEITNFGIIQQVDNETMFTVFGFARNCQNLSSIVPTTVINLCILFYYDEEFKIFNENTIKIHSDKHQITHLIDASSSTCYGKIRCASYDNDITYKWILKIVQCTHGNMIIGIDEAIGKWINSAFWHPGNKHTASYGMTSAGYKYVECSYSGSGHRWKTGDEVSVTLNCKDSILLLCINNQYTTTFNNIKKGNLIKYRLAIYTKSVGDSVSLISFSTSK
eukprot:85730_1